VAVAAGDVGSELPPVGSFGFELGFGAFGASSLRLGEGTLCFKLSGVAITQGIPFTGGIGADPFRFSAGISFRLAGTADLSVRGGASVSRGRDCFVTLTLRTFSIRAGRGDLFTDTLLGSGYLPGGVPADLFHLGLENAGGIFRVADGGFGGDLVVTGSGEGLGEGLGF
jgi:hypothetical protein